MLRLLRARTTESIFAALLLWASPYFWTGLPSARADVQEIPEDIGYQTSSLPEGTVRSVLVELAAPLLDQNFNLLDWSNSGDLRLFPLDQIFASRDWSERIYVKLGVVPRKSEHRNKLFGHARGFIHHGRSSSGVPYFAFFEVKSEARARFLARQLDASSPSARRSEELNDLFSRLMKHILPSAEASSELTAACGATPPSLLGTMAEGNLDAATVAVTATAGLSTELGQAALGCAWGALKGWAESSAGGVLATRELLASGFAVIRGKKSLETAVNEFTASFAVLAGLVRDFEGTLATLGSGISAAPARVKADLFCSFVAGAVTDVAKAIAVPASAALVVKELGERLLKYTRRLEGLTKFVEILSKTQDFAGAGFRSLSELREFQQRFFAKVAANLIPDDVLATIQKLSAVGLDRVSLRAARCAI